MKRQLALLTIVTMTLSCSSGCVIYDALGRIEAWKLEAFHGYRCQPPCNRPRWGCCLFAPRPLPMNAGFAPGGCCDSGCGDACCDSGCCDSGCDTGCGECGGGCDGGMISGGPAGGCSGCAGGVVEGAVPVAPGPANPAPGTYYETTPDRTQPAMPRPVE